MFRSHTDAVRVPVKESVVRNICYDCDLCDDGGWSTQADVEIHRMKRHKQEIYKMLYISKTMCPICFRQQGNKSALIRHVKTDHLFTSPDSTCIERDVYICEYCFCIFFNKKLLEAHMLYTHVLSKEKRKTAKIECPKCSKKVNGKSVWFHFLYHNMLTVSTCPICLEFIENTHLMLEHIKSHPGYYYCGICSYLTNKDVYFRNHREKHKKNKINVSLVPPVVDIDNYFFPPSPKIRLITTVLKIINPFKGIALYPDMKICIMCREICMDINEMRQHILVDHMPEREASTKMHMCACGQVFFNSVLLKHHVFKMKGVHTDIKHKALNDNEVAVKEENITVYEILDNKQEIDGERCVPEATIEVMIG